MQIDEAQYIRKDLQDVRKRLEYLSDSKLEPLGSFEFRLLRARALDSASRVLEGPSFENLLDDLRDARSATDLIILIDSAIENFDRYWIEGLGHRNNSAQLQELVDRAVLRSRLVRLICGAIGLVVTVAVVFATAGVVRLQSRVTTMGDLLSEAKRSVIEANQSLNMAEIERNSLVSRIAEFRESFDASKREMSRIREELRGLEAEVSSRKRAFDSKVTSLEIEMSANLDKTIAKFGEASTEIQKLVLDTTEIARTKAEESISLAIGDLSTIQSEVDKLNQKQVGIQGQLKSFEMEADLATTTIKNSTSTFSEYVDNQYKLIPGLVAEAARDKRSEIDARMNDVDESNRKFQTRLSELDGSITKLEADKKALEYRLEPIAFFENRVSSVENRTDEVLENLDLLRQRTQPIEDLITTIEDRSGPVMDELAIEMSKHDSVFAERLKFLFYSNETLVIYGALIMVLFAWPFGVVYFYRP